MKSGSIHFAGTNLALWGAVNFTLSRTPEPAPPARATHRRVDIAITMHLAAAMPATVWARARAVDRLLASSGQGLLVIEDENGNSVSWNATPGETGLGEAISRGQGRVEMKFSAIEPVAAETYPSAATVDMLDGSAPITLSRITAWNLRVTPSRPDAFSGHRTEVATAITMTARTAYADPLADLAARAEALIAEQTRLEALSGKEGLLSFHGFEKVVQFESVSVKPSEGWDYLEMEAQCRRTMLPGDTEAEVNFTVESDQDPTTGEIKTSLTGNVRAPERVTAEAKVEALLNAWRTTARRVVKIKKTEDWLDGRDSDTPQWLSLRFQIDLSEGSSDARYTLKIDTKESEAGARTTYSGNVHSSNLSTLMTTVESAAGGKHPVEISAELSIDYATDDEGTLKLSGATFSREYATASGRIRGNVQRSTTQGNFQDWNTSVSGSITAASLDTASAIARSLIPAGVILLTDDEKRNSSTAGSSIATRAEQEATLDFTFAWGSDHGHTSISYKDSTAPDYNKMTEKRTITGTCWATDKLTAAAQVALLLTELGMTHPTEASITHSNERRGNSGAAVNRWLSFDFTYGKEQAITGTIGHDIIDARWRIQRLGQVNHQPMTEIPNTKPVVQPGFGYNIGVLTVSGSVRARTMTAAVAWGQGKRAAGASQGGHAGAENPPDETVEQVMIPFNGTTAAFHEFSFNYGFRYADGLTGLWSGITL